MKRDLYQAFRVSDPAERSAILATVLPRLFTCHDIPTRRATAAPPVDDAAVLIEFDGGFFLVELRWSDRPLDFRQLAPHLVTLYGCPDLRGLLISSSGFTDQAIRDLSSIQPQRLVLCQLQEIVLLLEEGRDLKGLLLAKLRAAETERRPWLPIPSHRLQARPPHPGFWFQQSYPESSNRPARFYAMSRRDEESISAVPPMLQFGEVTG